jgi:stage III sporulation protein AD
MERFALIAIVGAVSALQMRTVRREYAVMIGIATSVLLLGECLVRFTGLSDAFARLCGEYGVPSALIGTALKILGAAYLTDFGVNIARDAGQAAIAGALEIGGRILVLSCALPSVVALIETGSALIREASP